MILFSVSWYVGECVRWLLRKCEILLHRNERRPCEKDGPPLDMQSKGTLSREQEVGSQHKLGHPCQGVHLVDTEYRQFLD